ncbi:MAG: rod shape-determining protein RodA [Bacteroidota bacterium]
MNRARLDIDIIAILIFALLVAWGWVTIYAVTSANGAEMLDFGTIHGKQLMWIGISLVAGILVMMLDYRFLEFISYIAYGGAMVLLILTIFIGKEVNGAQSWLIIGGQPFQPSEFAKMATALALAKFMSRLNFSMSDPRQMAIAAAMVILPALIVIKQNDTGSALVFGSFILVFFREGLNPILPIFILLVGMVAVLALWMSSAWWVVAGIVGIGLVSYFILNIANTQNWVRVGIIHVIAIAFFSAIALSTDFIVNKLPAHQQTRIMVLFDPGIDPQGKGYNVIQSKIAIGSGGMSGKGLFDGQYTKYKFVPKQETDFIFCTIGEELGWMGTSAVMILFFALLWRFQFLAENSKTRFTRIYGYGVISILFFHVLVNVGMTIGLVPVIGIPLPFFSYGGSSLLAFTLLIAILVNLHSYRSSVLGSKV